MNIHQAHSPEEMDAVRALFQEYATGTGVDLSYQDFAAELAGLPGAYAAPRGRLLLAANESGWVGCGAFRPSVGHACEMKRLYVRPSAQGHGVGKAMACRLIEEARRAGYSTMRLDTLPTMHGAIRLYESLGFVRRAPYYPTPIEGTVFMELELKTT